MNLVHSHHAAPSSDTLPDSAIHHGTTVSRRTNLALFAAGFATFSMLYCVQPLMPVFSKEYGVSAAGSALSLSLTTGVLAVAMLFAGNLSDRWGRKPVMVFSLFLSVLLVLCTGFVPNWYGFFALRALLGLTLSGLSAVAMTYINEEMHTESVGLGMGLYISGSAVGGMSGRLIAGVLANYWGWRVGIGAIGVTGLCASVIVLRLLPASRHFVPRALSWQRSLGHVSKIFKDPGLPWLFAEGFFLMGMFVTVYNYLGYRLMAAPYDFVALTCGFFGGHSIASSWVGRRTHIAKARAASLYLFLLYRLRYCRSEWRLALYSLGTEWSGRVGGHHGAQRFDDRVEIARVSAVSGRELGSVASGWFSAAVPVSRLMASVLCDDKPHEFLTLRQRCPVAYNARFLRENVHRRLAVWTPPALRLPVR